MNAIRWLVSLLLESESAEVDPKDYIIKSAKRKDWAYYALRSKVPPGGERRKGRGHDRQWEYRYRHWLFVLSTYDDGSQIWSAHYKVPVFSWSTEEEKHQGYGWSGGSEPVELGPGRDPNEYLARLKKMADGNPNPYQSSRVVPRMPPSIDPVAFHDH